MYRKGIPCNHPGCASRLSHPCEGCGRYAAGMLIGPDVEAAKRHIERLALENVTLHNVLTLGLKMGWSWQQILSVMVIELVSVNDGLTNELLELLTKMPNPVPIFGLDR